MPEPTLGKSDIELMINTVNFHELVKNQIQIKYEKAFTENKRKPRASL